MDSSLYRIIKTLIENGPTTTDELAYLENVSNRTIENRVKDLSSILEDTATIIKRGNAYSIVIHQYAEFLKIETKFLKGELDLNDPYTRRLSIVNSLLKRSDYVSIDEISDEIGLDKRVVNHALAELKTILQQYTGKIDNKRGKGLKLSFDNVAFALLLLRNIYQSNSQFINNDLLKKNENSLSSIKLEKKILSGIALNMTVLDQLQKSRGQILQKIPNFKPLWDETDPVIIELQKVFTTNFKELTEAEKLFLLSPLNLVKNKCMDQNKLELCFDENEKIIHSSLVRGSIKYGLNSAVIYEKIKWHVLFLINRCILHEKATELLPKNVSEKYPVAFEFALYLTKLIEKNFKVKVELNEINYLVLYFETAIEQSSSKKSENTVYLALIGQYRSSVKDFISSQLHELITNSKIDYFQREADFKSDRKYLLIISQKPFKYKDVPVVNVNILFRKNALTTVIAIALIEKYIEDGLVKISKYDLFSQTYYKLVKELVDHLVSDHELTNDFYDKWTKREKKSNNVISNGIAIPHAVDSSGKKRILLSFGIVKEKAYYNKTKLKLVFLIGIPAELDDRLVEVTSRVYDLISMISRNQILFENAENYDNQRPFIQMLEGI